MSLKRKVATGVAWMVLARLAARSLGLVSTLFLVRLLAPADFGVVAIATATAAALELLTLFSFDMALVQTKDIQRRHYDSAWTLNTGLGLALSLAILALAEPVAQFYREPQVVTVMTVLALKYVLDSSGNPRTVDFRRNLEFKPDFLLQFLPKLAGVLCTVPLARWLGDYRALLGGMLASSTAGLIMSYALRPYMPRWCLQEAKSLIRFSRWLLLNNFVSFLRIRSADFIVGRMLGTGALGLYSVAYEVAHLPSTEMVAPINRVLFPTYVQLGQDPERLRSAFRASLGMLALLILPVCVGMSGLAQPLVALLLGAKWAEATQLISLLAISGGVNVLQTITGSVYNALSKPRMIALTGGLHALTLIPMIIAGAWWGQLPGVAWAVLLHNALVGALVTYGLFLRTTPVRLSDLWSVCWRPAVASCVLYAALHWLHQRFTDAAAGMATQAMHLVLGVLIGAGSYLLTLAALWALSGRAQGSETTAWQFLWARWPRHGRPRE